MKDFESNQTVYIIESDGIASGDYIEYSDKKGGHKVRTSTSSSDYDIIKDELLWGSYYDAKEKFTNQNFKNKHFNKT